MSKFFIGRPIVAMVIAIVIVIVGLVVLRTLPTAQFPEITPPLVRVSTVFPGADAVSVEQAVAAPIEQQVNGVERMLYMQSTNAADGSMTLNVTFEVGTDLDTANMLVQNRIAQATPQLPADVNRFGVTVRNAYPSPLMVLTLYSPNGTYDSLFLTNYAAININDELLRVRGVGDVRNFGAGNYSMRIWVSPDRLAAAAVTVDDLARAIATQNIVAPGGQIGGAPAPEGQQFTYNVRTRGRLTTPEEFGDIVIREDPAGRRLLMKDVARVELGSETYALSGRYKGKPAGIIAIYQLPGSNSIAAANGIREAMARLSKRFPGDLAYDVALDTTLPVKAGIEEILVTLLEAVGLVALVVLLFLQSLRASIIPLLAVPVSLIGTFIFFPLLNFTINTLTLFGLVLAIGIVVDDAIVVVEAITHHIEEGMTPRDAALQAMREVSGPVVAVALVLVAVFVPVAFLGGITGRLYQQFALTLAGSVVISAFNALSLSPALGALVLRPPKPPRGPIGRFFAGFNRAFGKLTNGYVGVTGFLVRKAARSALFVLVVVGAVLLLGKRIPTSFVPEEDNGYLIINTQLPAAASLQRTSAATQKIEQMLAKVEGVRAYTTINGFSLLSGASSWDSATIFVALQPWDERSSKQTQIHALLGRINHEISTIPEGQAFAFLPPAIPGLGAAGGFTILLQDRSGGPPTYLAEQTERFLAEARKRPELTGLVSVYRAEVPQLFAAIDRSKVLKQGVEIAQVNATLQAYLGGAYINDINRFGRTYRVYLQAEPGDRSDPTDVGQLYVRSVSGEMVPLSTLVNVERSVGPAFTSRFNLFRAAQITGNAAPGYSSGQAIAALEDVARATLPPDMSYAWSGTSFQEQEAKGSVIPIFGLALVFVFLVLAAQYESWTLPFSVILGAPFALLGALLALFLGRFDNNVYAQIGLVMLIGLAAKNAVLIVEFARDQHLAGKPIVEATLAAARLRFRPILMTALAFILGVVPLMLAQPPGSAARRTMGAASFGGMLSATLIGVFMIPVLFVLIEGLVERRRRRRGEPPAPPAPDQPDTIST